MATGKVSEVNLFGVEGLTFSGLGIWGVLLYLTGMALKSFYDNRRLSLEDRVAKRDGFSRQVELLQNENRQLRQDIRNMEVRHDDYRQLCHDENERLRQHIMSLENDVIGFKRQLGAIGLSAVGQLTPEQLKTSVAGRIIDELSKPTE